MSIDLNVFDSKKGAVLDVLHPATDEPLGIKITLAGIDSDEYRAAQRDLVNKRLERSSGKRRSPPLKAEHVDADNLSLLAACTLSWEGLVVDGKEVECTQENAAAVYERFPWLREQVDSFVADRGNYLRD